MLIQYAYIKARSQFGKQCIFDDVGPAVEEHILPDSELDQNYIQQRKCDRGVQKSSQLALHELQTTSAPEKTTGMLHAEGGWPKEVNPKDEEVVQRFRRRVEKDDGWISSMKNLTTTMEGYMLQNNAIDIYENYFDDMIPTALTTPYDVRTINAYADPQPDARPVSHLSWSPGRSDRLAATYSFMEFEVPKRPVNPFSYVWNAENPIKPELALRTDSSLLAIEFNPRDPSMLISGMMSGQVCCWDIRTGDEPVQISHRRFSHRNPANQALWIASKTNTEFFSGSTDGTIKWWDIRRLSRPTDELVMDLEEPSRADVVRAIGVSALQFEASMGSRFMAGTQNGIVVNVSRKSATPVEKLAWRFSCHCGPVLAIDRNPFCSKYFLTVGDWTAKLWADDTREGCLMETCKEDTDLSGGCWSRSRHSVFCTINTRGLLDIYDILTGLQSPLITFSVCEGGLTAIAPHVEGQLLAIGSRAGSIYLLECSESLTINSRNEKATLTEYLERCGRFQKAADSRLREMRLMRVSARGEGPRDGAWSARGADKERAKSREHSRTKDKIDPPKTKSRFKRLGRGSLFSDDPELMEAELEYFRVVRAEAEKHWKLEEEHELQALGLMREMASKKERQQEPKAEQIKGRKGKKVGREKSKARKPRARSLARDRRGEEEASEVVAEESEESTEETKRRIARKILRKSCPIAVCKPKVCCMDVEAKLKEKLKAAPKKPIEDLSAGVPPRTQAYVLNEKWYRRLSELVGKIPEVSAARKARILALKEAPPDVLSKDVEEARKAVATWFSRKEQAKSWRGKSEGANEKLKSRRNASGDAAKDSSPLDVEDGAVDDAMESRSAMKSEAPLRDLGKGSMKN
ncbi:hypothetical protein KM043_012023 [Ampulex compressa]|nr:hypothetical protein KM043_012023 [Ampulex compressa]